MHFTRFLVEILSPIALCYIFSLLILLAMLFRRRVLAAGLIMLVIGMYLVFGYGWMARDQIMARESIYPPVGEEQLRVLQQDPPRFVVVLGSGHVSDARLPVTGQIGGSSLARLAEGIRLQRQLPEAKLVVSGGAVNDPVANARVVAAVAESLGVAKERMVVEDRPLDTVEEAKYLAPLLKDAPFLLVTSALHMPRAMAIFQSQGMRPVAAPTDYVIKNSSVPPPGSYLPSLANFDLSHRILYEWLGELWSRAKMAMAERKG